MWPGGVAAFDRPGVGTGKIVQLLPPSGLSPVDWSACWDTMDVPRITVPLAPLSQMFSKRPFNPNPSIPESTTRNAPGALKLRAGKVKRAG